jgi:hypothetical protein
MIFYSILFNFIIILHKIFGLLDVDFDIRNECSVRIQTDRGMETCLNHQCYYYKDPLRVVNSHIQDKPCYFHYLKLSFTNYDQFLVFIEFQRSNGKPLDDFFAAKDSNICALEIAIDNIYPFNPDYFLSSDTLFKLGGQESQIDLLKLEIKRWYNSSRSVVQLIDNNLIQKQPFQQISVLYKCNIDDTMKTLVLAKYLEIQERSTCPSQIKIISNENLYISDQETIDIQNYKPVKSHNQQRSQNSLNESIDYYNKKNKSNQSNLFAKVC